MSAKKIKTAVIGVGYLGRHHVEQLLGIPEADVVGVYDTNTETLADVQQRYGVKAFSSFDDVIESSEAVSVVVPNRIPAL